MSIKKLFLQLMMIHVLLYSIPAVGYAGTSTILGSTYDQCQAEIDAARNLATYIQTWSLNCGYATHNWNGAPTTVENIYQAAYANGAQYGISYYNGHGRTRIVWLIETHYDIVSDNGTWVADDWIHPYTICRNNRFVFLWACYQGNEIGGMHFWSGPYGMPHCWLHTTDLSTDGYANPDGKGYAFIGFYGVGPGLTQRFGETSNAGSIFMQWFYSRALLYNMSINEALDVAARMTWDPNNASYGFSDCPFYTGFTIGGEYGKMVVYGDGNMHIGHPPPNPPPPPEPCPFVCTWDGRGYTIDNNILPTSGRNREDDVEDYYKLEQPLVPIYQSRLFTLHSLKIQELEHEHDYIDQVELFVVDHPIGTKIAVSPFGEILTYRNPDQPYACTDNHGNDRLSKIFSVDGNVSDPSTYFYGERGDYLVVNFSRTNSENAKLILRSDMKCQNPDIGCCIEVQILNDGQWQTISVIAPRENWATEGINLSPYLPPSQELTVRLYWTLPHRLDYVGLDTTSQEEYTTRNSMLVSAVHSTTGNVLPKLMADDNDYAELTPGQNLQLVFLLQNPSRSMERTYVLFTEGHYYTIPEE